MDKVVASDLGHGIPVDRVPDGGMIQGKVGDEEVILARRGDEFFAVGAKCTHYSGALVEGLVVGDEVRCPLHHACFNLRTGHAVRRPAFDPIPCWRVERAGDTVFVREKLPVAARATASGSTSSQQAPSSVVIVGGGAAGLSAADTLRWEGYDGPVTIISADDAAPYDRPNLSKDYLAGEASEEWIPLRSPEYYADQRIDLRLNTRAVSLDTARKRIQLVDGGVCEFDRLLLATGAEPIRLTIPGAADIAVYYLRTYADSRALVAAATTAKRVVVVGGSFIGLEVAASLRARGIAVHVVLRGKQPLEHVMGPEVGRFVRGLHESHGVVFHTDDSVARVEGRRVILGSGAALEADFLVLGVGVKPSIALAESAGLKVDRGILVDSYLETSVPGIFAVGDIARWPDAHSGELVRIEHWVVAQRQGQTAARNILGRQEVFDAVPFFWTQQYGVSIRYVGHAERWDSIEVSGSLDAQDCAVTYRHTGRLLAVATISQDLQSLRAEVALEGT